MPYDGDDTTGHHCRLEPSSSSCQLALGIGADLEFTGERIVPGKVQEVTFREHEARYVFAGQFVMGKDVLDVACGAGIGTAYLLKVGARSCTGIDIDDRAVNYARIAYPECAFVQSDATNLALRDQSIDVVVSFETIEHLENQQKFLQECWRVLRVGGVFVCSTPNRTVTRWEKNRFHIRELGIREFAWLVECSFGNVKTYCQQARFLPVHVCRVVLRRTLERFGIKEGLKKLMGLEPPRLALRGEFREGIAEGSEITDYKSSVLEQPNFVIAVATKRVA